MFTEEGGAWDDNWKLVFNHWGHLEGLGYLLTRGIQGAPGEGTHVGEDRVLALEEMAPPCTAKVLT